MDKETLSNYGWIVVLVLVLAVMLALATPFGSFIAGAIKSTTAGLFNVNQAALGSAGIDVNDMVFENCDHLETEVRNTSDIYTGDTVCIECGKVLVAGEKIIFAHNGATIPDGGIYYVDVKATTIAKNYNSSCTSKYIGNESFPTTVSDRDVYVYGNYEYRYNMYFSQLSWKANSTPKDGWTVHCINNIADPGPILESINGKPVVSMGSAFSGCTNLEVAPEIPSCITEIGLAFDGCTSLTTAPIIPATIEGLSGTFWGCTALTGEVVINTETTVYSYCFYNIDFEAQKITLTGTSPHLDTIGNRTSGINYCTECRGYCRSNREKIPAGGTYYVGSKTTTISSNYNSSFTSKNVSGQSFPATVNDGDIYVYGNYEYRYNMYFSQLSWKANSTPKDGWTVHCINNIADPGPILESINGKPVVSMGSAFSGCTNLEVAPEIPSCITEIGLAFDGCTSLTTAPIIPATIEGLSGTFWGCTALTGEVVINTETTVYSYCFYNIDFEAQGITLTGTSTKLDVIGATGKNYCTECNGCCKGGH